MDFKDSHFQLIDNITKDKTIMLIVYRFVVLVTYPVCKPFKTFNHDTITIAMKFKG